MDAHRCLHYRWTQEEKINKNQWTESWRCRIGPNVRHPIQVGLRERLFVVVERGGYWLRLDFGASALLCSFRSRWLDQRERTADAQDRDNIPLETWC